MTRRRSPSFVAGFVSVGTVKHVSEGAKHAIHSEPGCPALCRVEKELERDALRRKTYPQSVHTIRLQVAPGTAKARPPSSPRAAFGRGTPGDQGGPSVFCGRASVGRRR